MSRKPHNAPPKRKNRPTKVALAELLAEDGRRQTHEDLPL